MAVIELDENDNVRAKSNIPANKPSNNKEITTVSVADSSKKHYLSNDAHQNSRITIWREEIIAKNNVQEKIKKQVFVYVYSFILNGILVILCYYIIRLS